MEAYQCRLVELVGTGTTKEHLDGFKMAMEYPLKLVDEYEE